MTWEQIEFLVIENDYMDIQIFTPSKEVTVGSCLTTSLPDMNPRKDFRVGLSLYNRRFNHYLTRRRSCKKDKKSFKPWQH